MNATNANTARAAEVADAVARIREAARTALSETKPESKDGGRDTDGGRQMTRSRLSETLELAERLLGAHEAREKVTGGTVAVSVQRA